METGSLLCEDLSQKAWARCSMVRGLDCHGDHICVEKNCLVVDLRVFLRRETLSARTECVFKEIETLSSRPESVFVERASWLCTEGVFTDRVF